MDMHNSFHHIMDTQVIGIVTQLILAVPFLIGLIIYLLAVIGSNRKFKQRWPIYRTSFWIVGIFCAVFTVTGPLAERAYVDFTAHMISHLLLGMLAPFLMVLAAPMTLILRVLPVTFARFLSRMLNSFVFRFICDPVVASSLNIGGLWILYSTSLYSMMHENPLVHILIHAHLFLAGYVFTIAMIYIDPTSHRTSYFYRSIVMTIALAAHGILAKYIYTNPPLGVSDSQAKMGGMLMYYGGDVIDAMIIFILCYQWYKASRARSSLLPTTTYT